MRLGLEKYYKSKILPTPIEAIRRFIVEDLLEEWITRPNWQDFRSRYLWTMDVNDVMWANRAGLKKLYERFHTVHKTWLEF